MPASERNYLTLACVLLSACTAVVDGKPTESAPGSAGSTSTEPQTAEPCTGASLIATRVRKITDQHYAQLVRELLPNATVPAVATPGTELALIKDEGKFVVRGPLAS